MWRMIMIPLPIGRNRLTLRALVEASCLALVLGLLAVAVSSVSARDEPPTKGHLELMQTAVSSLEPETEDPKFKAALALVSRPLLRYSDPTRGTDAGGAKLLLDAGVWRLGTEGRPTALVTIEIYGGTDEPRIVSFEFLSLTETKFALKHKTENVRWDATGSALALKELPDAPKPAATAPLRLTQMRQLVRRFAVKESYNGEQIECRLLAQPIDRYQSEAQKIADGAIFAFANGTNPEIGIVFETDGEHWQYGVLRLTASEATVALDGREVASYGFYDGQGRTGGPYHNTFYRIARGR
jgi:hypothetical protein